MNRLATLVLVLFVLMSSASAFGNEIDTGAAPAWVIRHDWQEPAVMPEAQISDGVHFLLLDRQVRITRQQTRKYCRVVKKVLDPQGVENASEIYIGFDPTYARLTIHTIRIHRDGKPIDQLHLEKMRVIQRESDLERRMYNGEKTATIILEDIRPGDCIEYAYTITGRNPVFEDRYMAEVDTAWAVPLETLRYRWIFANGRPVFHKTFGSRRNLEVRNIQNGIEYRYSDQAIDAVLADEDLPAWYKPYPRIQISQFSSWSEVVDWGTALYRLPRRLPPNLEARIEELKQSGTTAEKIAAALCLVQNEIRYLGMEIGAGSYQPTAPDITYKRRFGDCKDKSILLCTLLDQMGIPAKPALVNTYQRDRIRDTLPSPLAFNHVIVRVQDQDRFYWIDPTAYCQSVPLDQQYQALYGKALVLDSNVRALADTGKRKLSQPAKEIHEEFDLTEGVNRTAVFTVRTTFRGREADWFRNQIKSSSIRQTAKTYLNFYASDYPGITERKPMTVDDNPAANTIVVTEFYRIPEFWKASQDRKQSVGEVTSSEFRSLFRLPDTTFRNMPIGVKHPQYVTQRTTIKLPEPWHITPEHGMVENDTMRFTYAAAYADNVLTLSYDYRSKQDFVTATRSSGYIADLKRIKRQIGYSLTWSEQEPEISGIMIGAAMAGLLLAAGLGMAAWRYDPMAMHHLQSHPDNSALTGLGGWLVLVMLGLIARPLVMAKGIADLRPAFWTDYWEQAEAMVRAGHFTVFKILVGGELAVNMMLLSLSVILLVLFFKKRTAFPGLFIGIMFFNALVLAVDTILSGYLLKEANNLAPDESGQLVRTVIYAVIWSLYMLKSERVRLTFRNRRRSRPRPEPAAAPLAIEPEASAYS